MIERFLITGLPRSRTAWFATLASMSGRTCLHEPISQQGWPRFAELWRNETELGVSDSGALAHLDEILRLFRPKVIMIERPIDDVIASIRAYLESEPMFAGEVFDRMETIVQTMADMMRKSDNELIKRVQFDDLNHIDTVYECLDWIGVRPHGVVQMMHMNVQSDLCYNMNLLRDLFR